MLSEVTRTAVAAYVLRCATDRVNGTTRNEEEKDLISKLEKDIEKCFLKVIDELYAGNSVIIHKRDFPNLFSLPSDKTGIALINLECKAQRNFRLNIDSYDCTRDYRFSGDGTFTLKKDLPMEDSEL